MAARIIWSQEALDDIDAIAEYISRDSRYHAQRVAEEIFTVAESVAEQPQTGRVVPELENTNVRERFLYSYRIIYEIRADELHFLAIIHGKRLLESIEERFE